MHRETLIACTPYLVAIVALLICQWLLIRFSGGRLQLAQLKRLHRDQTGAVQSLSFILTLPVFLFIMMFIVQLSLITMARITVEYAAFAAARSAIVWIPANLGTELDAENRIGSAPLVLIREYEVRGRIYRVYHVEPTGDKYMQIHLAAAMACMPICPSINTGAPDSQLGNAMLPSIERAYRALAPGSTSNLRIPARLRNKLAYALAHTWVEIEVHHCGDRIYWGDVPLYPEMDLQPDFPDRYLRPNEIGWQDQVFVRVIHDYALLPGPGRLLARRTDNNVTGYDSVADQIQYRNGVFTRTLSAMTRLGNEGQKATPTIPSAEPPYRRSYIHPLPWLPRSF